MGNCNLTLVLKQKIKILNDNLKLRGQKLLSLKFSRNIILLYEGSYEFHLVEKSKEGKQRLLDFLNKEFKEHLPA